MRLQDELMALCPGQGWENRRFIMWELEAYAAAFDAEEIVRFLAAQAQDPVTAVRHQAVLSRLRVQPVVQHRRFLLRRFVGSVWTEQALERRSSEGIERPRPREDPPAPVSLAAAAAWLELPLVAGTMQLVHSDPTVRAQAAQAVSHLPLPAARAALAAAAKRHPGSFTALLACARAGDTELVAPEVERLLPNAPQAALLAACLPLEARDHVASMVLASSNSLARANLAIALGYAGVPLDHPAIERLQADPDPWVQVHLLRALAREPGPLTWDPLESTCRHASLSIL